MEKGLSAYKTNGFVDFALKYIAPAINDNNFKGVLTWLFKGIKTVFEGSTELGAKILHFILDKDGVAYHSQPSTWQRAFGYNDLYDLAFDIGSYMDKARYDFKSNTVLIRTRIH